MSRSDQKIAQYLSEAYASEIGLVSVLQSQIAMSPRGSYRDGLERHLGETRAHARRIDERLDELDQGRNPFQAFIGFTETLLGQAFALSKMPFDLLRGSGGEEKVLKNAKDACAAEALEIATYTALERLAINVGDEQTGKLAASIRADEERMLKRIMREIPKLTAAVVGAEIEGHPSYEITKTGAANGTHEVAREGKQTARKTQTRAKRTARQTRKVPGAAQVQGPPRAAVASEQDPPIQGYRSLSAQEIVSRLPELSQIELAKVESYERTNQNRTAVLTRISALRGEEPWPGYDELTVAEIEAVLSEGDDQRAQNVVAYERAHRNRPGVLQSALTPARFLLTRNT
jgi:ferritin-like metal-binding protein YciE